MRETLSKERERREQRGKGDDDDETPESGESVLIESTRRHEGETTEIHRCALEDVSAGASKQRKA